MKILIVPDSFKDCLTSRSVALCIEKGILKNYLLDTYSAKKLKMKNFPILSDFSMSAF